VIAVLRVTDLDGARREFQADRRTGAAARKMERLQDLLPPHHRRGHRDQDRDASSTSIGTSIR
jgi:hypothetical protein